MGLPNGRVAAEPAGVAETIRVRTPPIERLRPYFDPGLPWGCWLRVEDVDGGRRYVDDVTGEAFPDLRSAFWHGRLGMAGRDREPPQDLIEIIRTVLSCIAEGSRPWEETVSRTFDGSVIAARWFMLWLSSVGFVEFDHHGDGGSRLTGEGSSALDMLTLTRPGEYDDPAGGSAAGRKTLPDLDRSRA